LAAFPKSKGASDGTYKLLFEGARITVENTPLDLEMMEGDIIDAYLDAVGGY